MTDAGEWNGVERRRSDRREPGPGESVAREEISELVAISSELAGSVTALREQLEVQRRSARRGRARMDDLEEQEQRFRFGRLRVAVFVAIYTVIVVFAAGVVADRHVELCMKPGAVVTEQDQRWCNLQVPFHNHPVATASDEQLQRLESRFGGLDQLGP